MAQAIADAIIDTLDDAGIRDTTMNDYRVQVAAFRNRQLADNMAATLRNQGFVVNILEEDGLYKVVVGEFSNLDNAVALEQRLRMMGYNTFIRT